MMPLEDLFRFTELTHKFQKVKRIILANGEDRPENDAEHSYQLAIVAWYIINTYDLDYDLELIFEYALAHDLVEVYAGDTFFHTKDKNERESKKDREELAAKQIAEEFPDFKELHKIIHRYEKRADKEARFVYALDKLLPVMNIYLDEGKSWHKHRVTLKMIRTKDEKIATSPDVEKIWNELVKLLDKYEDKLFPEVFE